MAARSFGVWLSVALLTLICAPAEAHPPIPSNFVPVPIGWTHPSCVHRVPNGARVDEYDNVYVNERMIAHYDKCPYPWILSDILATPPTSSGPDAGIVETVVDGGIFASPAESGPVGPGGSSGWLEGAYQYVSYDYPWDYIYGLYQVPTAPANHVSDAGVEQTLYFWQGLQSNTPNPPTGAAPPESPGPPNGDCGLLQPVLQWGPNPWGGGEYWSFASWWWVTSYGPPPGYPSYNGYVSDFVESDVNTSDYIQSYISLGSEDGGEWEIYMYDQESTYSANLYVPNVCNYNNYFAIAEADSGGGQITNCGEVPHQMHFTDIYVCQGNPSLYSYDCITPSMSFWFQSGLPSCQWSVSAGSSGNEGWTTLTMK